METELHQLGLPKEHSNAICKVYSKDQKRLEQALKHQHNHVGRDSKEAAARNLSFTWTDNNQVMCEIKR